MLNRRAFLTATTAVLAGTPIATPGVPEATPLPESSREHPLPMDTLVEMEGLAVRVVERDPEGEMTVEATPAALAMPDWMFTALTVHFENHRDELAFPRKILRFVLHGRSGNYYPFSPPVVPGLPGMMTATAGIDTGRARDLRLVWEIKEEDREGLVLEIAPIDALMGQSVWLSLDDRTTKASR